MAKKIMLPVAFLVAALPACASNDNQWFNQALSAADQGSSANLDHYRSMAKGSIIEYYPEYWQLNNRLLSQSPSTIVNFARRYPGSAMAEKLAADYVEAKVSAGDYSSAKAVVGYVTNPDSSEQCAVAQARGRTGDRIAYAEQKSVWLVTDSQPSLCTGLANMMVDSPLFSTKDKQQRLWTMLRGGEIGSAINIGRKIGVQLSVSQLNSIASSPSQYLNSAPSRSAEDHAYAIYALGRLANTSLSSAQYQLPRIVAKMPADVQRYLYRTVAYIGGTTVMVNGFDPSLVGYFDRSLGYPFSEEEAVIYARQSIRFGRWNSLTQAIQAMPIQQRQENRWQYWLARAYEQQSDSALKSKAKQIYQQVAEQGDYHSFLALDRLGKRFSGNGRDQQPSASATRRLNQDIHFQRAFALKAVQAPANYANREWNWAVRQAYLKHDDDLLLAAAKQALNMEWYDRSIYAADRTTKKHNYKYRYAMPYQSLVVQNSSRFSIDPAWAYGIMRQESRFIAAARSHVGAGGLMQVMPATARDIARDLGESYSQSALSNITTNVRYGTYYLSSTKRNLSNNMVLATAGYNAGASRARRWQPEGGSLAADQYAESIPLHETRDYVKNVMENSMYYGELLGQRSQSIGQRMSAIPMRTQ